MRLLLHDSEIILTNANATDEHLKPSNDAQLEESVRHSPPKGKGTTTLHASDMLFLLDSDMYVVAPLDFHRELGTGNHLLTWLQWRPGSSRRVYYMWPNFSLFYFGDLSPSRALKLFRELEFGNHCHTDGAVMDSRACTAAFLDKYAKELGVVDFVKSCSISHEPIDRNICNFLAEENTVPRPTQCTTSYVLESEAVAANPQCEHIPIHGDWEAWEPGSSLRRQQNDSSQDPSCGSHGKIYHLGSAGSNWRGCPEDFLEGQRVRLFAYLESLLKT